MNNAGSITVDSIYKEIGCFSNEERVTPVFDGNLWHYIDESGYKKLLFHFLH